MTWRGAGLRFYDSFTVSCRTRNKMSDAGEYWSFSSEFYSLSDSVGRCTVPAARSGPFRLRLVSSVAEEREGLHLAVFHYLGTSVCRYVDIEHRINRLFSGIPCSEWMHCWVQCIVCLWFRHECCRTCGRERSECPLMVVCEQLRGRHCPKPV